jgi:anti-sigma B factor antagonist
MAAAELKHLRLRDADGVAVVGFVDSELMYATDLVLDIGSELKSVLKDLGRNLILLEFDDVQYVSSTMLAQLAHLEREVRNAKGQLKICGLGPILKDTFRIGRFDFIFDIHPDEASALKSFRKA